MKPLKKIAFFLSALLISFTLVQCSDDEGEAAPDTYMVSGSVTYPDYSGTSAAAAGAVVYLVKDATAASMSYDLSTVANTSGAYKFEGLETGDYYIFVNYNTANTNSASRVEGINFDSGEGYLFSIADADVVQDAALVSAGQATNFTVNTTEGGDWNSDVSHSNVNFEFPYDNGNATYTGRFTGIETMEINFDPANLASGSINVSIDLLSVNTSSPGGRDALYNADGSFWQDETTGEYDLGCISGTYGIDSPDDADRYATFTATGFEAYGDGYIATGTFTFRGTSNTETVFFRLIEGFEGENRQGVLTRYSSFEAKLVFAAQADYGVESGHVLDSDVTIYVSYQVNKPA